MTTYARLDANNVVHEVASLAAFETFNPQTQALFIVCPDNVQANWTYTPATQSWSAPPAPPTPPTLYRLLTPMEFYLSFTPTERMKIKALAAAGGVPANSPLFGSTNAAIPQDPEIAEFWATYELAAQVNSHIDPNLSSIQGGLNYLAAPTAPTPAVITTARIAQILAGVPQ